MAALPWPAGWRNRSFDRGCAGLAALVLAPVAWGVAAAVHGAASVAWLALGSLLLLLYAAVPRHAGAASHDPARRALVLPFDRGRARRAAGVLAALAVLALAAGGPAPKALVAAALCACAATWQWLDAAREADVVLSERGVAGRGWSLGWDAMAEVAATESKRVRRVTLRRRDGGTHAVAAAGLAVDPLRTYWAIRFYATHPEARAELADGRAADRVARGDLR